MTKVTIIKGKSVQAVLFFNTNDQAKARMLARMQAPARAKLIVESH